MPYTEFPSDFYRELRSEERECRAFFAELSPEDFTETVTLHKRSAGRLHRFADWELAPIPYKLEVFEEKEKSVVLMGWCVDTGEVGVDISGTQTKTTLRRLHRYDINRLFPGLAGEYLSGFELRLERGEQDVFPFTLTLSSQSGDAITLPLQHRDMRPYQLYQKRSLWWYINKGKKAWTVFYEDGARAVAKKIKKKVVKDSSYGEWMERYEPSREELLSQKRQQKELAYRPKISIVVPLYHTPLPFLEELLSSVTEQTYDNWELCLVDAGADEHGGSELAPLIKKRAEGDGRICYQVLEENKRIAENTNEAIRMASGEFVGFIDHDDTLSKNALFACVQTINAHPDCDVLYTDQDMLSEDGKRRFEPLMKPDFSIDFLRCCNYISHFFVVRRSLLDEVGYLDGAYDGSQDYDLTLRCVEKARGIYHIPKVLYHWRMAGTSTAEDPGTKTYAYEAGRRAIDAHFKRVGIPADAEITEYYGKYRIHYHWDRTPLVSVLIPNKDHIKELDTCLCSLQRMSYHNLEIIIIENNSEEEETFAYYEQAKKRWSNVTVEYYEGDFNYSKINNFGAKRARGEFLLLLNNDTEIISRDFMEELLGYGLRKDVGVVGPRLFYEDGTIQHAGVVVGYGNVAGHAFLNFLPNDFGMLGRVVSAQNYSAVTAAALLVKSEVFAQVGGLTEELAVAFNDTDFCLKVRKLGLLVVYTPFATAYHYESKSRGYETTPEKKARYEKEADIFRARWNQILTEGDPYYSPNLTLDYADFSLRMR